MLLQLPANTRSETERTPFKIIQKTSKVVPTFCKLEIKELERSV